MSISRQHASLRALPWGLQHIHLSPCASLRLTFAVENVFFAWRQHDCALRVLAYIQSKCLRLQTLHLSSLLITFLSSEGTHNLIPRMCQCLCTCIGYMACWYLPLCRIPDSHTHMRCLLCMLQAGQALLVCGPCAHDTDAKALLHNLPSPATADDRMVAYTMQHETK